LQDLLDKYGKLYSRQTKRKNFDEVNVREVAFKAFKVTYDRVKGYIGHKANGDEFHLPSTEFDKILCVSKDGEYKVIPVEEKTYVGSNLIYVDHPERDEVYTMVYQTKDACFLKRFTFGGAIMNKVYSLTPEKGKAKIVFLEKGTPEKLYIRYKPVPRQKINQQTCSPKDLAVKSAKARGKQISIKSISNIGTKPTRNWEPDEPTTEVVMA